MLFILIDKKMITDKTEIPEKKEETTVKRMDTVMLRNILKFIRCLRSLVCKKKHDNV